MQNKKCHTNMSRAKLEPIRVVIADPGEIFREGLRAPLAAEKDCALALGVSTAAEALAACAEHGVHVLVLSYCLIGADWMAFMARVRSEVPETRLILVGDQPSTEEVIASGGWGRLAPDIRVAEALRAIRAVSRGEIWASRQILTRILCQLWENDRDRPAELGGLRLSDGRDGPALSPRETEILRLVARGHTNERIASLLYVERSTIKTHLLRIFRKLAVRDRASAVRSAMHLGLLNSDGKSD